VVDVALSDVFCFFSEAENGVVAFSSSSGEHAESSECPLFPVFALKNIYILLAYFIHRPKHRETQLYFFQHHSVDFS
jgi:hypothetical protein